MNLLRRLRSLFPSFLDSRWAQVPGRCFLVAAWLLLQPLLQAQPIGPVKEFSPFRYGATRADGMHFFMERIDDGAPGAKDRLAFWTWFAAAEERSERAYRVAYLNLPADGRARMPLKFSARTSYLMEGLAGFKEDLRFHGPNELWVAYATPDAIPAPDVSNADRIEMYVGVLTAPGAPMVVHMGIQRGFAYLCRAAAAPGAPGSAPHPGLSLSLHAFAAQVMILREPAKLYMITSPHPVMRDLLLKALPGHAYLGSTFTRAQHQVEHGEVRPDLKAIEVEMEGIKRSWNQLNNQAIDLGHAISRLMGHPPAEAALLEEKEAQLADLEARKAPLSQDWLRLKARYVSGLSLLARTLPILPNDPPIFETRNPWELRILGKDRVTPVFEYRQGDASGAPSLGTAINYDWFIQHRWIHHEALPYVTLDLDALARLSEAPHPGTAGEERKESKEAKAP